MVVFDLFLHIWQLIKKEYFITFIHYDLFWVTYWSIFLILLIYEFRKAKKIKGK